MLDAWAKLVVWEILGRPDALICSTGARSVIEKADCGVKRINGIPVSARQWRC